MNWKVERKGWGFAGPLMEGPAWPHFAIINLTSLVLVFLYLMHFRGTGLITNRRLDVLFSCAAVAAARVTRLSTHLGPTHSFVCSHSLLLTPSLVHATLLLQHLNSLASTNTESLVALRVRNMLTLRRKVFALSIVIAFFLLVIHFIFQPLTADNLRSLISGSPYAEKLVGNLLDPSTTTLRHETQTELEPTATETSQAAIPDKILVVAKLKSEDTDWIDKNFPDWKTAIYTVDDPNADLHTSKNKGHEANVYLTYIIDNYSDLPPIMVFLHSHQKHKHGTRDFESIDYDNLETIKALRIEFVRRTGYANLRCLVNPGCPAEIQPFRPDEERDPLRPQENAMAGAWAELFGNDNVPQVIATPCCAQFAVSREQVLKRPKDEYERFLKWLYNTPLDDFTSGRIFEYLWHVIFGRDPVYCPDMDNCYREQYGTT